MAVQPEAIEQEPIAFARVRLAKTRSAGYDADLTPLSILSSVRRMDTEGPPSRLNRNGPRDLLLRLAIRGVRSRFLWHNLAYADNASLSPSDG